MPKPNCIEGVGAKNKPSDTAGALNELLDSVNKPDEQFLADLMNYDFTRIVCHGGWYFANLEKTELSFFHLLARYDTGSIAAKFGDPNSATNSFVNKMHGVFVNPNLRNKVIQFIETINGIDVVHQDNPGSVEKLIDFKVNGKTAEVWATEALASASRPDATEKEKGCKDRFEKLLGIINWIKNPNSIPREEFAQIQPNVAENTEPLTDSEGSPDSVTSDNSDNPMVQELNDKIKDCNKTINDSNAAISKIEEVTKQTIKGLPWSTFFSNNGEIIAASKIANKLITAIKIDLEKAKNDKTEAETELEELNRSLDLAEEHKSTGKFGGKKSKKRKSRRKSKNHNKKQNKNRKSKRL